MRKGSVAVRLVVSLNLCFALSLYAGEYDRTFNVSSGNWGALDSWLEGAEPTNGNPVLINNEGTVTIDQMGEFCQDLNLGLNENDLGKVFMSSGSFRAMGGSYIGSSSARENTFDQAGGDADVGVLVLGENAGAKGSYTMTGGNLVTSWTSIGEGGTGIFTQSSGISDLSNCFLGWDTNSTGICHFSGNSKINTSQLHVGSHGNGTLIQTGQAELNGGSDLVVGGEVGGTGDYTLSENAKATFGYEYVGSGGKGTFTQTGGTHTMDYLYLGKSSEGTYIFSGGALKCGGSIAVGGEGNGQFIQSGGTLNASDVYIGSNGKFSIENPSSQIKVTGGFYLLSGSEFHAVPGTIITTGAFHNHCTSEAALADLVNLELKFDGNNPLGYSEIEAASRRGGGFENNFAIGALTIGQDAPEELFLVDSVDNGNRGSGSECLYLNSLNIFDGSILNLNGLDLYVRGDMANLFNTWIQDGRLINRMGSIDKSLWATYDPVNNLTFVPEPATFVLLSAFAFLGLPKKKR